jgi:GDP-4-dehydro-6-deoxy-D-mannose reductase
LPITKALVTGATGFAGRHLLEKLAGRTALTAWQRPGGSSIPSSPAAEWRAVDVTDRDAVAREVERAAPDAIFHLAGAPSVSTSWRNCLPHLRINVLGTHNLLEAIRRAGRPCRVLVVSSAQVYRPAETALGEESPLQPASPYGLSKLGQEQLALRASLEDDLDVVIARPFNHIGPGQSAEFAVASFARQIARIEAGLEKPTLRVGNLSAKRDTTDVRDVAEAYVRLAMQGERGRTYNICSGEAPSIGDLLEMLTAEAAVPVTREIAAERMRPHDVPLMLGRGDRIAAETGWSPVIPLRQSLVDVLDFWRAEVRAERS